MSLIDVVRRHAIDVRPLRHAAYRRLFVGNVFSFLGYQLTAVAVPVEMYLITKSSLWVGLLGFAGLFPLIGFSLWGGAMADAMDRRRVLMASSSVAWASTAALCAQALLGVGSRWLLLVIVAVQSGAFAVSSATRSAVVSRLVPEEEIASASTLNYTASTLGAILGPLAAGVVLAGGDERGIALAYGLDAAMFTVAMWAVFRLPEMRPLVEVGTSRWRDLVDGLAYLRTTPIVLLTFVIDIAAMVLALPRALFPEVAEERFGGQAAVGWLFSAIAIGSLVAGVASGWVGRVRRQGIAIVVAVAIWGLSVAAAGLAPWLWLAVLLLAVGGAADMISAVYRQTVLLTYAPDEMRGRLQGAFIAVVAGGPRLGDLRVGATAVVTGATVSWVGGGIAAALVAVLLGVAYPALLRYTPTKSAG
ncbi:MFS transporter [Virgisporangium aliadipatigenens]|uniref:MFS transporter n=1 Tax=Virgisporangium aliadipatigenens TaxID=741659 RepID=A0A8J4DP22_9ACTN|nr:MFS transporter [Virgisporangium aliadipatigenens]GIJ44441.1 MFS transporter [Virgisporangium aliadipatigenens]